VQIYIMFKINNGKILKTTKKSHYKGVVINILFVNTCIFLVTYHKCMYALWNTNEITGLKDVYNHPCTCIQPKTNMSLKLVCNHLCAFFFILLLCLNKPVISLVFHKAYIHLWYVTRNIHVLTNKMFMTTPL
jgi:hypothetical protein